MANPIGTIFTPEGNSNPDGNEQFGLMMGKNGEVLVAEVRGKYYSTAYRGCTYGYAVNAVTLPVNAASVVSKFAVINPAGSGKNLELIRIDWAYAVATTVVNGLAVYYLNPSQTALSTTYTTATAQALNLGNPTSSVAIPCSSLTTVSGTTPAQVALVGYTGAVTSTAANVNQYNFDGAIIVPPGYSIQISNTVAASTASGFSGMISWAEHSI